MWPVVSGARSGARVASQELGLAFSSTETHKGSAQFIKLLFKYLLGRRRQWHPTPVLLSEKSHGRRNLVGCSPWGRQESDTTEQLHFHFSLSCIGEGNGNPLQCSCLENPRDEGAWWAAVSGVAQNLTRLKRLSSSSSSRSQAVGNPVIACPQGASV